MVVLTPINRNLFDLAEANGEFCAPSAHAGPERLETQFPIAASNPCGDTLLDLEAGHSYLIKAEVAAAPAQVGARWLFQPLRRWLRYGWSDAIVQVSHVDSRAGEPTHERIGIETKLNPEGAQARPESKGRLYVYRNNVVIAPAFGWPARAIWGSEQPFHGDDKGEILSTVKDISRNEGPAGKTPGSR